MLDIFLVGAGGFVGANARFIVATYFAKRFGTSFPYGTLFINVTGSFILGLFLALAAHAVITDEALRWLIAVGFCGGYTTFSTFTFETLTLIREKRPFQAIFGNVLVSYVLGLAAALLGTVIGNSL